MSPELQRLLGAYHEKRTCPSEEKIRKDANFERLLRDALARKPGVSRDELLNAIKERYVDFRVQALRAQRDRLSRLK